MQSKVTEYRFLTRAPPIVFSMICVNRLQSTHVHYFDISLKNSPSKIPNFISYSTEYLSTCNITTYIIWLILVDGERHLQLILSMPINQFPFFFSLSHFFHCSMKYVLFPFTIPKNKFTIK